MAKLTTEIDDTNDFGFSDISSVDLNEADVLKEIHDLVNPLIENLLKDADKEMIKWPNRGPSLKKFQKKLKALTKQG